MKFFCSSLDIRDNLKVTFFGKILSNMSWYLPQKRIFPCLYLVINMTDWLSRVFVKLLLHLVTAIERKDANERLAQGASAVCNKNISGISQLNTAGQCQSYREAGPAHRPQLKFLTKQSQHSKGGGGDKSIIWKMSFLYLSASIWLRTIIFNIIWHNLSKVFDYYSL